MMVKIDPELCIGCGVCEDICPAVFKVIEGVAVAIHKEKCGEAGCCEDAAAACPTGAIEIIR